MRTRIIAVVFAHFAEIMLGVGALLIVSWLDSMNKVRTDDFLHRHGAAVIGLLLLSKPVFNILRAILHLVWARKGDVDAPTIGMLVRGYLAPEPGQWCAWTNVSFHDWQIDGRSSIKLGLVYAASATLYIVVAPWINATVAGSDSDIEKAAAVGAAGLLMFVVGGFAKLQWEELDARAARLAAQWSSDLATAAPSTRLAGKCE